MLRRTTHSVMDKKKQEEAIIKLRKQFELMQKKIDALEKKIDKNEV